MQIPVPPEFPFFEVDVPARSPVPDLDAFKIGFTATTPWDRKNWLELRRRLQVPVSLDMLKELISYGDLWFASYNRLFRNAEPVYSGRPCIESYFPYEDARKWIIANRNAKEINACISTDKKFKAPGALAEKNAHDAAKAIFKQHVCAPQSSLSPGALRCEAVLTSVWLDTGKGNPDYPFIVDQLWVIAAKDRRVLVAVEIDGDNKWLDTCRGCGDQTPRQHNAERSRKLMESGLIIYRISSAECKKSVDHAKQQLLELCKQLGKAEKLVQRGFTGPICTDPDRYLAWVLPDMPC